MAPTRCNHFPAERRRVLVWLLRRSVTPIGSVRAGGRSQGPEAGAPRHHHFSMTKSAAAGQASPGLAPSRPTSSSKGTHLVQRQSRSPQAQDGQTQGDRRRPRDAVADLGASQDVTASPSNRLSAADRRGRRKAHHEDLHGNTPLRAQGVQRSPFDGKPDLQAPPHRSRRATRHQVLINAARRAPPHLHRRGRQPVDDQFGPVRAQVRRRDGR